MAKIKITANAQRTVKVSGRFLSIINANFNFVVSAPEFGDLVGEVGRQFELESVKEVTFKNETDSQLDLEFEVANIKVHTSGKGIVKVGNEVTVNRIAQRLTVDTERNNPVNSQSQDDVTIPAGQKRKLLDMNAGRYETLLQVISTTKTKLRIGSSDVGVNNGVTVSGSESVPGTMSFNDGSELWAFNTSGTTATIAIIEVLQ